MKNILIILGCLFLSQTLYGGPKLGRFTSLSTLCAAQLGELGLKQKDPDILKKHFDPKKYSNNVRISSIINFWLSINTKFLFGIKKQTGLIEDIT